MKFGLVVVILAISFLYCCKSANIKTDLQDANEAIKKLGDKETYLDTLRSLDDWGTRLVISAAMTVFYLSAEDTDLEDEVNSSMWSKYLALKSVIKALQDTHHNLVKGLPLQDFPIQLGIQEVNIEAMDTQIQLAITNTGIIGKFHKDTLLMMYEKDNAEISQKLYTAMTSEDINNNIFQLARKNYKNDKRATLKFVIATTIFYLHSVYHDTSYRLLKSDSDDEIDDILNDVLSTTQSTLAVLGEIINQLDIDLTNAYKQQFRLDVDNYLHGETSPNSYTMAEKLYELLEKKYYWRQWFVVITGNVKEVDINVNTCDGLSVMNFKNKHIFVASANLEELFNSDMAMEHLRRATDTISVDAFWLTKKSHAVSINERISASCSNFKMFGTFTVNTEAAIFGRNRQFKTSVKVYIPKYYYTSFIMG